MTTTKPPVASDTPLGNSRNGGHFAVIAEDVPASRPSSKTFGVRVSFRYQGLTNRHFHALPNEYPAVVTDHRITTVDPTGMASRTAAGDSAFSRSTAWPRRRRTRRADIRENRVALREPSVLSDPRPTPSLLPVDERCHGNAVAG